MPINDVTNEYLRRQLVKWNIDPSKDDSQDEAAFLNTRTATKELLFNALLSLQTFNRVIKENRMEVAEDIAGQVFALAEINELRTKFKAQLRNLTNSRLPKKPGVLSKPNGVVEGEIFTLGQEVSAYVANIPEADIVKKFKNKSVEETRELVAEAQNQLKQITADFNSRNIAAAKIHFQEMKDTLSGLRPLESFQQKMNTLKVATKSLSDDIKAKGLKTRAELDALPERKRTALEKEATLRGIASTKTLIENELETLDETPKALAKTYKIPDKDMPAFKAEIIKQKQELNAALLDLISLESLYSAEPLRSRKLGEKVEALVAAVNNPSNTPQDTFLATYEFGEFLQKNFPGKSFEEIEQELNPFLKSFEDKPVTNVANINMLLGGVAASRGDIDVSADDALSRQQQGLQAKLMLGMKVIASLYGDVKSAAEEKKYEEDEEIPQPIKRTGKAIEEYIEAIKASTRETITSASQGDEKDLNRVVNDAFNDRLDAIEAEGKKYFAAAISLEGYEWELKQRLGVLNEAFAKATQTTKPIRGIFKSPKAKAEYVELKAIYSAIDTFIKYPPKSEIIKTLQQSSAVPIDKILESTYVELDSVIKALAERNVPVAKRNLKKFQSLSGVKSQAEEYIAELSSASKSVAKLVKDIREGKAPVNVSEIEASINSRMILMHRNPKNLLMPDNDRADFEKEVVKRKTKLMSHLQDLIQINGTQFPNTVGNILFKQLESDSSEEKKKGMAALLEMVGYKNPLYADTDTQVDFIEAIYARYSSAFDAKAVKDKDELRQLQLQGNRKTPATASQMKSKIKDILQNIAGLSETLANFPKDKIPLLPTWTQIIARVCVYTVDGLQRSFMGTDVDTNKPLPEKVTAKGLAPVFSNIKVNDGRLISSDVGAKAKGGNYLFPYLGQDGSLHVHTVRVRQSVENGKHNTGKDISEALTTDVVNRMVDSISWRSPVDPVVVLGPKAPDNVYLASILLRDFTEAVTDNTASPAKANEDNYKMLGRGLMASMIMGTSFVPKAGTRLERSVDIVPGRDGKIPYFGDYPVAVTRSEEFLRGVIMAANFDRVQLKTAIEQRVDYLVNKFGAETFARDYAAKLDMSNDNKPMQARLKDKTTAAAAAKEFLVDVAFARQFAAQKYFLETSYNKPDTAGVTQAVAREYLVASNPMYFIVNPKSEIDAFKILHARAGDDMAQLMNADFENLKIKDRKKEDIIADLAGTYIKRLNAAISVLSDPAQFSTADLGKLDASGKSLHELSTLTAYLQSAMATYKTKDKAILVMACDSAYNQLATLYDKIAKADLDNAKIVAFTDSQRQVASYAAPKPAGFKKLRVSVPDEPIANAMGGIASSPVGSPSASPSHSPAHSPSMFNTPRSHPPTPRDEKKSEEVASHDSRVIDKLFNYAEKVSQFFQEDKAVQESLRLFGNSRVQARDATQQYSDANDKIKDLLDRLGPFPSDKIAIPQGIERSKPMDEQEFREKFKLTEALPASLEADIDPKTRTLKDRQCAVNYMLSAAAAADPALKREAVKTAACYVESRKGDRYSIASMRLPQEAIDHPTQKVGNTAELMPSDAYLKYVDKQISSFIAEVGSHRTVHIQPSQDANLVQAYVLVCLAKGLNYKVSSKNQTIWTDYAADSRAVGIVNDRITAGILLPKPRVHAEVKQLIAELHAIAKDDASVAGLSQTLMSKIDNGKTPGPEEVHRVVEKLDQHLQKNAVNLRAGPQAHH